MRDLAEWLTAIQVLDCDTLNRDLLSAYDFYGTGVYLHPAGWFGVIDIDNNEGIFAYFATEADADRFRLDYIDRQLNQHNT